MMNDLARERRNIAETRYMAAHEELWRNSVLERIARVGYETSEYRALNHEANLSAAGVPWWRQFILDIRVKRKLGVQIRAGK